MSTRDVASKGRRPALEGDGTVIKPKDSIEMVTGLERPLARGLHV
jgi:hypothetical protein